jgi:hypothetical protein
MCPVRSVTYVSGRSSISLSSAALEAIASDANDPAHQNGIASCSSSPGF